MASVRHYAELLWLTSGGVGWLGRKNRFKSKKSDLNQMNLIFYIFFFFYLKQKTKIANPGLGGRGLMGRCFWLRLHPNLPIPFGGFSVLKISICSQFHSWRLKYLWIRVGILAHLHVIDPLFCLWMHKFQLRLNITCPLGCACIHNGVKLSHGKSLTMSHFCPPHLCKLRTFKKNFYCSLT